MSKSKRTITPLFNNKVEVSGPAVYWQNFIDLGVLLKTTYFPSLILKLNNKLHRLEFFVEQQMVLAVRISEEEGKVYVTAETLLAEHFYDLIRLAAGGATVYFVPIGNQ
jgi:hypothetical protein